MKTKTLIAMFLTGMLTLSLAGCNDPIEKDPDIVEPGNGNGDDGNDDGGNDDGGNNGLIDPSTGTWENKDEDGDGVLDESDDYPFNSDKSSYAEFVEEEFNNNQDVATLIDQPLPVRIKGKAQQDNDLDFYKVELEKGTQVTILLSSSSFDFQPGMAVMDKTGVAITAWSPEFQPLGRYKRAIQVSPNESGNFYIVINDKRFIGGDDFNYQLDVFIDSDNDALDDNKEKAFGLHGYTQDSDNDGINDGTEFYVFKRDEVYAHDFDNDGIPNWLDDDSDNDEVRDKFELATDFDADTFGNFVDTDSDNNGSVDSIDAVNLSQPVNSDGDQFPDFVDMDDDNDLILDVNDLEPLSSAVNGEFGTSDYVDYRGVSYLLDGAYPIHGIAIENMKHRFHGTGLGNGYLVFSIKGSNTPINVPVTSSGTYIDFVMPSNVEKIAFVKKHVMNAPVALKMSSQYVPIVIQDDELVLRAGETAVLNGRNFSNDLVVLAGEQEIAPLDITSNQISFIVPSELNVSSLTVKNSYGTSNEVKVSLVRSLSVSLSDEMTFSDSIYIHSFASSQNVVLSKSANVLQVDNAGYDFLPVYLTKNNKYILNALFLGQEELTISFDHLAIGTAWKVSAIDKNIGQKKLLELYEQAIELTEVISLREFISSNVNQPEMFDSTEFINLKWAAGESLTRLYKTNFATKQSKSHSPYYQHAGVSRALGKSSNSPELGPSITSNWADSDDTLEIFPTKKWHSIQNFKVYTGDFGVKNDTSILLSPEFSLLNSADAEPLQKHISEWFSPDIIGAQDWGILNIAATKEFKHCSYFDCKVSIVTPGFNGPALEGGELTAQRYLIGRTMVEQILLPIMEKFLNNSALLKDRQFTKDLLLAVYPYVSAAYDIRNAESNWDRVKKFAELVHKDLTGDGYERPLTEFIRTRLGQAALNAMKQEVAEFIVIKFIPVVGQIDLVLEVLSGINLANKLGQTLHDFIDIPNKVEFEARWPTSIRSITPTRLIKPNITSNVEFTLEGIGMGYESCLLWGYRCSFEKPKVKLYDLGGDAAELSIDSDLITINSEATMVTFEVDKAWLISAKGKIRVELEIADIVIDAPEQIEFTDKVSLTKLMPTEAQPGSTVIARGAGFIPNKTNIVVSTENGPQSAQIISIKDNELKFVVPDNAITGPVYVEVEGISSDPLELKIANNGITVKFGDNGNFQDDRFSVSIGGDSGISMDSVGQRLKEFHKQISPGEYTATLTANEIPDARGTFYICFSDNVEILQGPQQSSKDVLTSQDQKLTWKINVLSGSGNSVSSCAFIKTDENSEFVKIMWNEN